MRKAHKRNYNPTIAVLILLSVFSLSSAAGQEEDSAVQYDPALLNNSGVKLLNEGKLAEAVSVLERARAYDPADTKISSNLAHAYLSIAERTLKEGNIEEATRLADNVLNLEIEEGSVREKFAHIYYLIANAYSDKKEHSQAASILTTALTIDPQNFFLRYNLGTAFYRDTRREEALREFRSILYDDPKHAMARKMCGIILYDMGEMQQAMEELNYAVQANPQDNEAKTLLEKIKKEYKVEKDFGVDRYQHFTVSVDGNADYLIASEVIGALEAAYSSVGRDLNYFPEEKMAVVIYPDRSLNEILDKHKSLGGIYDGRKIRLPVKGLEEYADRDRVRRILTHEYAHVVVHFTTNNNSPLWLNEGIAEYESRVWEERFGDIIRSAASEGAFIPLGEISSALKAFGSNRISLAYLEAFSIVRFIADTYGVYNLRRILDGLYERKPIGEAVHEALFIDLKQLEREWLRSLGIDS